MPSEILYIENVDEEIKVEVNFDYDPEDKNVGFSAQIAVYEVFREDNGVELCFLPKAQGLIEEELLEKIEESRYEIHHFKKYGYLLSDY